MNTTPNAASVALFSGTSVLLIERAREPLRGYWTLPGGRIEPGEQPDGCARREVMEELGLAIGDLIPVTIFEPAPDYVLAVFATALSDSPTRIANEEISDWRWVELEELATMRTTPRLAEIVGAARQKLSAGPKSR